MPISAEVRFYSFLHRFTSFIYSHDSAPFNHPDFNFKTVDIDAVVAEFEILCKNLFPDQLCPDEIVRANIHIHLGFNTVVPYLISENEYLRRWIARTHPHLDREYCSKIYWPIAYYFD